jgi:drug/metabolite transporter (DMT)-like permease
MVMLSLIESGVVGSEAILALYPILIKTIPVNLPTQIVSRLLTFTGAAGVAASKEDWLSVFGNPAALQRTLGLGALTSLHVYVSYVAFSSLSTGVAMSLFYTYPLWNLMGARFFFGEATHPDTFKLMAIGILGTFLVSTKGMSDEIRGITRNSAGVLIGVLAALAAAATESGMYFAVKVNERNNPWSSTLELYGGALLCLLPLLLLQLIRVTFSWATWGPMILFNLIIGFAGYALRFYTIPKVSTEVFGLLSFTGVLASFVFGYLFLKERPSLWSLVGATMIAYAASRIETIKSPNVASPKDALQPPDQLSASQ